MPDKTRKPPKPNSHPRHPHPDIADLAVPIPLTERRKLLQLRDWVIELNAKYDYRQIASFTWRGEKGFGYIQRLAKGHHLKHPAEIRPIGLDWKDIYVFRSILKLIENEREDVREECLSILEAQVELSSRVIKLMRKRKLKVEQ